MQKLNTMNDIEKVFFLDFENSKKIFPKLYLNRNSATTTVSENGVIEVDANKPRLHFDVDARRCIGLVSEAGSTNLILNSNSFRSTNTANIVEDTSIQTPIPGAVVHKLTTLTTASATTKGTALNISTIGLSGDYCFSYYLRLNPATPIKGCRMRVAEQRTEDGITTSVYLGDSILEHGGKLRIQAIDKTIESVGNDWYRISFSFSLHPNTSSLDLGLYIYGDNWDWQYVNGGHILWFAGWQFEKGTAPTSLISTSGSQMTRESDFQYIDLKDLLPSTGFSIAYSHNSASSVEYPVFFSKELETFTNFVGVRQNNNTILINNTNVAKTYTLPHVPHINKSTKVCASFGETGSALIVDGVAGAITNNAGGTSDYSELRYLKFNKISNTRVPVGRSILNRLMIIPRVLKEEELRALNKLI